eukprot:27581_1
MGTVSCCKTSLFNPNSYIYNTDIKQEENQTIPLSVQEWLCKISKNDLIKSGVYDYKAINNFQTIRNYMKCNILLENKICIVTQCSLDRINSLKKMSLLWYP